MTTSDFTTPDVTELETRLAAALNEHADHLTDSGDAWEQNQARLAPVRGSRRMRSPLLVAAAVLAITASVATFAVINRSAPVATTVSTADCTFGQNMPGSFAAYSATAPGSGALISIDADKSGRSCFFDGIAWHAAAATQGRIESLGTSTAAGRSWVWVTLSATPGATADQVVFLDDSGQVLQVKPAIDNSSFDGSGGWRVIVVPVSGSGSVRIESDGKVLAERRFDTSTGYDSRGPVLLPAPAPTLTGSTLWPGAPLLCPRGIPDATTAQPVVGGTSVSISLYRTGAAGEPAICLQSATPPVAIVPSADHDSLAITRMSDGRNLLWGFFGSDAARAEIIINENPKTVFVAGPAQPGTTAMGKLGSYRTFAVILPSDATGFSYGAMSVDGKHLAQGQPRR